MPRRCPDDGSNLEVKTVHGLQVDVCERCGGVWLDKGEMAKLRKLEGEQIQDIDETDIDPKRTRPNKPPCPVCSRTMFLFKYAGGKATIDACPNQDGLWIPDDELDKIAAMQEVPPEAAAAIFGMALESQSRIEKYQRLELAFRVMGHRRGWPWIW